MKTVNIMEVRTAVAFMKPFVGLIFFVRNNSLRFLLLIDIIIISLVIENTLSIPLENQIKFIIIKKTNTNT